MNKIKNNLSNTNINNISVNSLKKSLQNTNTNITVPNINVSSKNKLEIYSVKLNNSNKGPTGPEGPTGIGFGVNGNMYGQNIRWNQTNNSWEIMGDTISIGTNSGYKEQGEFSVAIGFQAGSNFQGQNSIAIGYKSGVNNQISNSIILNATNGVLDANINSGFFVAPLSEVSDTNVSNILCYDTNTKEIQYNSQKTFVIDHPLDENKYLVHACLEGPEAGVYYRGEGEITNNSCTTVKLPDYVSTISTHLTVQITHIFDGKVKIFSASRVENNQFQVYGENGSFFWIVHGKRISIDTEPNKSGVNVQGEGPYKWLN